MAHVVTQEHVRQGEKIFRTISIALKDFMLYGDTHPHFKQTASHLIELMEGFSAENAELRGLTFLFKKGQVHLGRVPLPTVNTSSWRSRSSG